MCVSTCSNDFPFLFWLLLLWIVSRFIKRERKKGKSLETLWICSLWGQFFIFNFSSSSSAKLLFLLLCSALISKDLLNSILIPNSNEDVRFCSVDPNKKNKFPDNRHRVRFYGAPITRLHNRTDWQISDTCEWESDRKRVCNLNWFYAYFDFATHPITNCKYKKISLFSHLVIAFRKLQSGWRLFLGFGRSSSKITWKKIIFFRLRQAS